MNRLSEKIKVVYLSIFILFIFGVFFYLLDSWGLIRLENYVPFLSKTPTEVSMDHDSASELELERIAKEEDRLKEEEIRLQELASKLDTDKEEIERRTRELEEMKRGLEEEKGKLEEQRTAEIERARMVRDMSGRIGNMPPDDAVAIVAGWSDSDLVDVFLQMERDADNNGTQSIVPYLITKLPRDRASVITSLMMDDEARKLPQVN